MDPITHAQLKSLITETKGGNAKDKLKNLVTEALERCIGERPWAVVADDLSARNIEGFDPAHFKRQSSNSGRAGVNIYVSFLYWMYDSQQSDFKTREDLKLEAIAIFHELWKCSAEEAYRQHKGKKAAEVKAKKTVQIDADTESSDPLAICPQPHLQFPDEQEYQEPTIAAESACSWLSPLVTNTLPFISREREMAALNGFMDDSRPFLIWAISGPSGAGKTRLVVEWMRMLKSSSTHADWNIGFITAEKLEIWRGLGGSWQQWQPNTTTIVAVDYLHIYSNDAREIMANGFRQGVAPYKDSAKVRVILVDHSMPAHIHDLLVEDVRFRKLSSDSIIDDMKKQMFFKSGPLLLTSESQSEYLISSIMNEAVNAAGGSITVDKLSSALNELRIIPGAWAPLFAALRGYALTRMPNAIFGDRRELVRTYLNTSNRLPWRFADSDNDASALCAAVFVGAATAIRGAPLSLLLDQILPDLASQVSPEKIVSLCSWITSRESQPILLQLEPDIIRESYILLMIDWLRLADRQYENIFIAIICGCEKERPSGALQLFGFLQHMHDNLMQDQADWSARQFASLVDFFRPKKFADSAVKAVLSIALADIADRLPCLTVSQQSAGLVSYAIEACRSHVRADDLRRAMSTPLRFAATKAIMRIWELDQIGGTPEPGIDDVLIECLISLSYWLRLQGEGNVTPFHIVCVRKNIQLFEFVLAKTKPDINGRIKHGITPLLLSVEARNAPAVERLSKMEAIRINDSDEHGNTPLNKATIHNYPEIVRILLACSTINVNVPRLDGATPLWVASCFGYLEVIDELLKHHDIDILKSTISGECPLWIACNEGQVGAAQRLADHPSVDLNQQCALGTSPVYTAAFMGNAKVVKLLVSKVNVDPNRVESRGASPLFTACTESKVEVVGILLSRGDVNVNQEFRSWTALFAAVHVESVELVNLLLRRSDIDVNHRNSDGDSALHLAVYIGNAELVERLVSDDRTNIEIEDRSGLSPLGAAAVNKRRDLFDMIYLCGKDQRYRKWFGIPVPERTIEAYLKIFV